MSQKPGIPSIPALDNVGLVHALQSMKENIELLTGIRGGSITTLSPNATLADVISKINEVINRLNGRA